MLNLILLGAMVIHIFVRIVIMRSQKNLYVLILGKDLVCLLFSANRILLNQDSVPYAELSSMPHIQKIIAGLNSPVLPPPAPLLELSTIPAPAVMRPNQNRLPLWAMIGGRPAAKMPPARPPALFSMTVPAVMRQKPRRFPSLLKTTPGPKPSALPPLAPLLERLITSAPSATRPNQNPYPPWTTIGTKPAVPRPPA